MNKFAIALLPALMVGCLSTGNNFPSDISWIKKSATKLTDVNHVLGEPFSVGSAGGTPTWTYAYYKYSLFDKSYHKELKVYSEDGKTVTNFSFTSSFPADLAILKAQDKIPAPVSKDKAHPEY